jgi:hypothetical protein
VPTIQSTTRWRGVGTERVLSITGQEPHDHDKPRLVGRIGHTLTADGRGAVLGALAGLCRESTSWRPDPRLPEPPFSGPNHPTLAYHVRAAMFEPLLLLQTHRTSAEVAKRPRQLARGPISEQFSNLVLRRENLLDTRTLRLHAPTLSLSPALHLLGTSGSSVAR